MLYFGLVCTAIAEDRQQLRHGMNLLAEIAHKYRIPISWVINADSAQFLAKELTNWHNEFKDEPILFLDVKPIWDSNWLNLTSKSGPESDEENVAIDISMSSASPELIAEHLVKMRETLPNRIRTEWRKIERAFEWAVPSVVGALWKNHILLHVLEQLGFKGLWGYRWNDRDSDGEIDRGCPFGLFYPSSDQHNFSTPTSGSIVGIPYNSTAHLNGVPDNLRTALINNTSILNYDIYLQNENWNRWLSYIEHVYAIEVAHLGQETLSLLDEYFAHVVNFENTKFLPLSEIVDDYWTNCQQTEPTYVIADKNRVINNPNSDISETRQTSYKNDSQTNGTQKVLYFYDAECQLIFYDGEIEPTEMKNYITPPMVDAQDRYNSYQKTSIHGTEYHLPKVSQFRSIRNRSQLHLTFTIESTKAMPYGIVIWGNHLGLQLAKSNVKYVKWVDKYLLFIRLALEQGNNEFEIVLTI